MELVMSIDKYVNGICILEPVYHYLFGIGRINGDYYTCLVVSTFFSRVGIRLLRTRTAICYMFLTNIDRCGFIYVGMLVSHE